MRNIFRKLGRWGTRAVIGIALSLIASLILVFVILPLSEESPMPPNVNFSSGANPVINTNDTQSIIITAIPDFKPPYSNDISATIQNPNSYECYMVLELRASDGFKFLSISDTLPQNFSVEDGYEFDDVIKVAISNFPPKFTYNLILTVYTMNPDAFAGTENVTFELLEVKEE